MLSLIMAKEEGSSNCLCAKGICVGSEWKECTILMKLTYAISRYVKFLGLHTQIQSLTGFWVGWSWATPWIPHDHPLAQ